MIRFLRPVPVRGLASAFAVTAVAAALFAASAGATVGPPVQVRLQGSPPAPARAGEPFAGAFQVEAGKRGGVLADLAIAGEGWSVRSDAPRTLVLGPHARRAFAFNGIPTDPEAPLVVTGTIDDIPFRTELRLGPSTLGRTPGPGGVRAERTPILSGIGEAKGATGRLAGGQSIRVHGRVMYTRSDNQSIGADNVVVIVMDDDSPGSDEEMGRFLTNSDGTFDVTLNWDDCDISGCDDPDVYMVYEAANLVVEVRRDTGDFDMYRWSTENNTIEDFTGNDIDFGTQFPDADDAALHIYNSIVRAHRFAQVQGGLAAPHVFAHWPSMSTSTGAFYSEDFNELHIGAAQTWDEAVHSHEYGHHLSEHFSVLDPPNYNNGFCDTPTPGHCGWCPENTKDAWQEGFADWFASFRMRTWNADYGSQPLGITNTIYQFELTQNCGDGQPYLNGSTEGVIAAILEDIEDATNEDNDGGTLDCRRDVLTLGADEIFKVFLDDDPTSIGGFVTAFRNRWPEHDANLWATIGNTAPVLLFTQPAPSVKSQPVACQVLHPGQSFTLSVQTTGVTNTFQWRRNGVALGNGAGINGVTTATLSMNPVAAWMEGDWDCVVTNCEGGLTLTSALSRIGVDSPPNDQPLISWGENGTAQVGKGTTSGSSAFHLHSALTDVIAADGGRSFSMALRKDGTLLTWGLGDHGALGNGTWFGTVTTPQAVADSVTRIAAGRAHAIALLRDGSVRSWGWNFRGALGTGDHDFRNVPSPTRFTGCVRDIAASDENSYVLLDDGTVWSVGLNDYGSLGNGTTGSLTNTPTQVAISDVIAIEAAGFWCMALKADRTVWTWGNNDNGQLGLGHYTAVSTPTQVPGLANIVEISAGVDNAHVRRADGIVYGWGYGPAIGIGWTGGSSNVPQQLALTGVDAIGSGASYGVALIDGQLKAWGLNAAVDPPTPGVLGNTGPYVQGSPVDVPTVHAVSGFGTGWGTLHAFGALGVTGIEDPPGGDLPTVLALRAGPNPAHGTASIAFDLPVAAPVSLRVYDVAGRRVHELVDEPREAGRHAVTWDGRTRTGTRAAAGTYFVRLQAGDRMMARTLILLD